MPLTFQIFENAGYFSVEWTGQIGETEMVEAYKNFLDAQDSMGHFREFCDLSAADLSEIQLSGLQWLSKIVKDYCERNGIEDARCACFVPAELNQGLMALYDTISNESAEVTRVFTDKDKAMAWLMS